MTGNIFAGARARRASAVVAGLTGLALVTLSSGGAFAGAAQGDVDVVNTETVQVYLDSHGQIQSKRVYEQLTLTGDGTAEIVNPIEEAGLRNLDGFSGYEVEDGLQQVSVDVDGVERLRSVSDFSGDLPLQVSVDYRLDGERINPDDLVGADGALEVVYTVRNLTAKQQQITYPDGKGGTITETAEVPVPMVGSLTTVAPPNFSDVASEQANMAGDGKGGTKMSFTMTLFPPLGSDEVSFGYTANVTDGVVPGASISALPVNPLESPTFKAAGASYKSGSDTGVKLADGATEIDTNLLRLRDGAGALLSGLIQLSDGADQLNAGLSGEAAPGAARLASGALQLDDGLGQIDSGAGKLSVGAGALKTGAVKLNDGAGQLATGTGAALTGSEKLEDGLKQISGGLGTLADDSTGLPTAVAGVVALQAGVNQLLAGFGSTTQDGTLLFGLNSLESGLAQLEGGANQLVGGLVQLRGDGSTATPGLVAARGGVDQVKVGLDRALSQQPADLANPDPDVASLAKLRMGISSLSANCDIDEPTCQPTIDALLSGVDRSRTNLTNASSGLGQVSGGLGTAIGGLNAQLIPGAQQIAGGLTAAKAGATKTKAGAIALRDGTDKVGGGLGQLKTGLAKAVAGVLQLSSGATAAYTGSGELTDGLVKIDGGAGQLADGAGLLADGTDKLAVGANRLADGTSRAKDGSTQLADGAGRLSVGLGDAADGSGRLADGLERAASGAPALRDGATRLSEEGMSKLVEAGEATAQDYGKLYAVIGAGAERADAEKMAYGAPEGAQGLTAYSFELAGDDGEGGRNAMRGLGALALLAAGLGALGLRRRFA